MDISERAVEDLRALGADVTSIDAPFSMDALWESWITLRSWSVASGAGIFYDDPEKRDLLKPAAIWEIERGFAHHRIVVGSGGGGDHGRARRGGAGGARARRRGSARNLERARSATAR